MGLAARFASNFQKFRARCLEDKIKSAETIDANWLVAADAGCMLQIGGRIIQARQQHQAPSPCPGPRRTEQPGLARGISALNTTFNQRANSAFGEYPSAGSSSSGYGQIRQPARSGIPESTAAPLALRAKAREIRRKTFDELDIHLETLFKNLTNLGVHIHPAADAESAKRIVLDIARKHGVKTVVKSKSMASEEIHLNQALEAAGITPYETDLGEWILQLANETPSHLVAPAIHKTLKQVQDLFREKVDPNSGSDPQELTSIAREKLRTEFMRAGMGISGVNFAVAETGTLCLVTNEGNGRLVTTLPKVHVAIMGFEKVVPTLRDTLTLLSVLPRSATGQKLTSYFTMLTGPRRENEADGPDEVHLVLLDGGRSRHLGTPFQEAFHCIRCGACQNACPVFQTVGGHTYDSVYGGPIGSILSPMLRGLEVSGELPRGIESMRRLYGGLSRFC